MTYRETIFYETPIGIIPHYTVLECIVGLCFTVITVVLNLPFEYIGENPVPTVIFKGRPTTFHAFMICVLLAFSGATRAMVSPNDCKFARFCGYFSMACLASAFAILFGAFFCACTG